MEIIEQTLQVNEFARRSRHLKIFSKGGLVKVHLGYFFSNTWNSAKKLLNNPLFNSVRKLLAFFKMAFVRAIPVSPQRRLFVQALFVSSVAIVVTSLTPGGTFTPTAMSYSSDYLATYYMPGDVLVTDDSGYLVKVNPQTNESNRIGLTDFAVHTVESGEAMSSIAKKYNVKVETIMWENNIVNSNTLRVGQKLLIPPVDGVGYKVAAGDTLNKIAAKYNVKAEAIIAQNGLGVADVFKGQDLFLPGAKPIEAPTLVVSDRNAAVGRSSRSSISSAPSTSRPNLGKMFIFPTIGEITQGFHSGHYALDIANRSMPPIWAAASGTVVLATSGTWGGGYGTHVIIDHGNGIKTLYGHMSVLNVTEGQWVNQGDVIGTMGHTGHVYGEIGRAHV